MNLNLYYNAESNTLKVDISSNCTGTVPLLASENIEKINQILQKDVKTITLNLSQVNEANTQVMTLVEFIKAKAPSANIKFSKAHNNITLGLPPGCFG